MMNDFPPRHIVESLKKRYPRFTRVELVSMNDKNAPPEGTQGEVLAVDDIGTIHVAWDTGSLLGVVYGEDKVRIVGKKDNNAEWV